jgi:hypothetical protein
MGTRSSVWVCAIGLVLACGGPAGGVAEASRAPSPSLAADTPSAPSRPDDVPAVRVEDGQPGVDPADDPAAERDSVPSPAPTRRGHADLDPTNDLVLGPPAPIEDCEARLGAAKVTFKPARIGTSREVDGVPMCGAKQAVRVKRGPGAIKYSSSPLLTCTMALALADFERIAQEEAERAFASRIVAIEHLGTFNCREMAMYDLVSEHSFANGLDLRRFTLANGTVIDVLKHFRPADAEPPDAKSRFLRTLANRLFDEEVFSVVVTPFFDRMHRNHIHVDLARYRVDGSRP